jgi:hypothetical protein
MLIFPAGSRPALKNAGFFMDTISAWKSQPLLHGRACLFLMEEFASLHGRVRLLFMEEIVSSLWKSLLPWWVRLPTPVQLRKLHGRQYLPFHRTSAEHGWQHAQPCPTSLANLRLTTCSTLTRKPAQP